MELKLVYRALRRISDWTVNGYYAELLVEGQDNVPEQGPLVLASTHHNEIIDIATLSITVPYGRHVSFWAKSSMFKNPILGAILSSSGAIPVKRNPNATDKVSPNNISATDSEKLCPSSTARQCSVGGESTPMLSHDRTVAKKADDRSSLFWHTSRALAQGEVVGVFPEGTSYTQPSIVQVLPGAGWIGVEFLKHKGQAKRADVGRRVGEESLTIVPVAIVYTNKARYRSRVYVRYGKPILVDQLASDFDHHEESDEEANSKALVQAIMQQVEKSLRDMTINAPDWDTLCAASTVMSILWTDEDKIPLDDWVAVFQKLIDFLNPHHNPSRQLPGLKDLLTRYHAALYYTGIKHSTLCSLVPLGGGFTGASAELVPSRRPILRATLSMLSTAFPAVVRLLLFLPPVIVHLPAYLMGYLAGKLAPVGEDEAVAQFSGVGGGLGLGMSLLVVLRWFGQQRAKKVPVWLLHLFLVHGPKFGLPAPSTVVKRWLRQVARSSIVAAGTVYLGVRLLVKWHSYMVDSNYRQLERLLVYFKLLSSTMWPVRTTPDGIERYTKPPLPAENPFIRRMKAQSGDQMPGSQEVDLSSRPRPAAPCSQTRRFLALHLLETRRAASQHLLNVLNEVKNETYKRFLVERGALR